MGPLEPQSRPGDGAVMLGVHGLLLAASSERDIPPNGLLLLLADRGLRHHQETAASGRPRQPNSASEVRVAGRGVATTLDDRTIPGVSRC